MLRRPARFQKTLSPAKFVRKRPVSLFPVSHWFSVFVSYLTVKGRMMVMRVFTLGAGFMLELRARIFLRSQLDSIFALCGVI